MNPSQSPDPLRPGTLEEAIAQGLTEDEFDRIAEVLGREPNVTELAIFAVMWSEHCSYKNSILELKKLPRSGGRLMVDAGEENAGLVDIGDGWAVSFKIESHNHPSAVEPFQGAATGVGGILRDIFTMGARPLAALNSLRFGDLKDARTRYLLDGVVRGIGHYGNCFGVPTVAGEVYFDSSYSGNPLVNAMAVGVVRHDRIAYARATCEGNPVYYVGSRTGRDGIHGATFASDELSGEDDAKRPSVQVGDPFAEKLLLEATLELTGSEALVGIQDMGAAGLTCSSTEMAAAGNSGMEINLDLIPMRETDIEPWEIMLSESQERMLLVAKAGHEEEIERIFKRWDLEASKVGVVTSDGMVRVTHQGRMVAEVPAWYLVLGGGAPQYIRQSQPPADLEQKNAFDPLTLPEVADPGNTLLGLLGDLDIASKSWVYQQYDQSVRTNTALEPGFGDAAVVRVEGTNKGLALTTDGNGRYVSLNPRVGAQLSVMEAARNVACVGGTPLAITNCLNFGNPYKPEVFYFFKEAVAGMGEACRALGTPVTGGNVSFHNETLGKAVIPTPVIGMLGLLEDVSTFVGAGFAGENDEIYVLGEPQDHGLGGSSYLKVVHGMILGSLVPPDFDHEKRLIELLGDLTNRRLIKSAHDVSDGGLAVTIAESCINRRGYSIGAVIDYPAADSLAAHLFGEAPGRVVISVTREKFTIIEKLARDKGVPVRKIGVTGGDRFIWGGGFDLPLSEVSAAYYDALPSAMDT